MCLAPSVPDPIEYQKSQTPAYREGMNGPRSSGRRGTILGSASSGTAPGESLGSTGGMTNTGVAAKRTLLGG